MPGTVYTVASGKGGVGKTTTTVNLGVALWQEGNAVAIVDADLGMANLSAVLGLEPETTLHDVLAGDVILEEALVEAKGGDLLVLPGSRDLEGFAAANPQKLREVLDNLAARCDYVIVDTGAGLGYEDVLPLGLGDAVILVSSADPASLGDTRKTAELAGLVQTPVLGVVVTRAVEGTDSAAIAAEIGAELLGTVPEDPAVMEATVAGDPLASHAPNSAATAAYQELGSVVLEADLPTPEPEADRTARDSGLFDPDDPADEDADAGAADDEATDEPAVAEADTEGDEATEEPTEDATLDEPEGADEEAGPGRAAEPPETDDDQETAADPGGTVAGGAPSTDSSEEDPSDLADGSEDGDADAEDSGDSPDDDVPEPNQTQGGEESDVAAEDEVTDEREDGEAPADSDDTDDAADDGPGGLRGWLGRLFS